MCVKLYSLKKNCSFLHFTNERLLESSNLANLDDIYENGIYLTGGGAMLRGLDKRLSLKTKLPIHIAEDPLRAVVRGTGSALKELDNYKPVLMT